MPRRWSSCHGTSQERSARGAQASAPSSEHEVWEVARTRGGARVLRVLATADDEGGAHAALRTIRGEEGPDIGAIWILDTATRLWLFRSER